MRDGPLPTPARPSAAARAPLSRVTAGVLLATAAAGVTILLAGARPEAILARDYGAALATTDTTWDTGRPQNLWLSRHEQVPALRRALSVGDRVTIAGTGSSDSIDVTGLEVVDGAPLGLPGTKLQIVTGHSANGPAGETVRFLFAVEPTPANTVGKSDKVL